MWDDFLKDVSIWVKDTHWKNCVLLNSGKAIIKIEAWPLLTCMEVERCQAMKVIFKSINVFEIGLYFSNLFKFLKSVPIIFKSNYLFQIELYCSNQFIFFKSVYIYKFQI